MADDLTTWQNVQAFVQALAQKTAPYASPSPPPVPGANFPYAADQYKIYNNFGPYSGVHLLGNTRSAMDQAQEIADTVRKHR